jgi:hypothetical protein
MGACHRTLLGFALWRLRCRVCHWRARCSPQPASVLTAATRAGPWAGSSLLLARLHTHVLKAAGSWMHALTSPAACSYCPGERSPCPTTCQTSPLPARHRCHRTSSSARRALPAGHVCARPLLPAPHISPHSVITQGRRGLLPAPVATFSSLRTCRASGRWWGGSDGGCWVVGSSVLPNHAAMPCRLVGRSPTSQGGCLPTVGGAILRIGCCPTAGPAQSAARWQRASPAPQATHHQHALARHPPKHHVLLVQPVGLGAGDEELAAVAVGAAVGHGQQPGPGVPPDEVLVREAAGQGGGRAQARARVEGRRRSWVRW